MRSTSPVAIAAAVCAAIAVLALAPAPASARSFAPDVQVSADPAAANQAPQLTQGLTREPMVLACDSNNPPTTTDCGEQAIKQLSFKLPRKWRVNGESLVEPCNLPPSDPVKDDSLTPIDPSLCPPAGQVGTVDANIQIKTCVFILPLCALGLQPLTITVGASGKIYYVNSYQYYNNPELGNRADWAQEALAAGDPNGNSLPAILAIQIDALGLIGPPPYESLNIMPPFYMAAYLSRDNFRIQTDLTPDAEMFGPNSAWADTAIVQRMDLALSGGTQTGLFRTPVTQQDACAGTQDFWIGATSYADTVAGAPPVDPAPPLDPEQTIEYTRSVPALTGCDQVNPPFAPAVSVSSSTTEAGKNPVLRVKMERGAGQTYLTGVKMTLPEGMVGSPYATTELCTPAEAEQNACPAASRAGDATTTVAVFENRLVDLHANVYQAPVEGSELARFLTVIDGPPIANEQVVVLPATMSMLPGARGIEAEVQSLPPEFDIRKLEFAFDGTTGADRQHPLLINPSSCNPGELKVDFGSEIGQQSSATAPYQATACDAQPYDPNLDVTLTCNSPHCQPGISATVTQAYGEATTSETKLTIPSSFTLNLQNPIVPCSRADLASDTCPASSKMGSAVVESPLAIDPLQGEIYLAEPDPSSPDVLRTIHAKITGLVNMSVDTDLKSNPSGGFDTVVRNLPQVPISKLQLNFDGGQNALVNAPYGCGPQSFQAEFTSHSGRRVSKTGNIEIAGTECAPKMSASVSPNRAGAKSKLTLNARPNTGTIIRKAKFNLGSLKVRGLGKSRSARELGSLTLTPTSGKRGVSSLVTKGGRKITAKPGKGSRGALSTRKTKVSIGKDSLSISGLPDQALSEINLVFNKNRTKALRNPKKCGKVKIAGRFTDTKGQTYKSKAKVRIGCAKRSKRR